MGIRDFFGDRRDGVFLDVGAHHYQNESNTYFLETALGWSGLAVDAIPEFGPEYVIHRPKSTFVAMFASDRDGETTTLFEPHTEKRTASMNQEFTVRKGEKGTARQVPTATLNTLLSEAGIAHVDFLSMDIELAEPKALAGFDIERFKPELVCIEVHPKCDSRSSTTSRSVATCSSANISASIQPTSIFSRCVVEAVARIRSIPTPRERQRQVAGTIAEGDAQRGRRGPKTYSVATGCPCR